MSNVGRHESLIREAIALLDANGHRIAASDLRRELAAAASAPTLAARRRRLERVQPPSVWFGGAVELHGALRHFRTAAQRLAQEQYRQVTAVLQAS